MLGTSVKRLSAAAAGIAAVRLPTHCFAEEPNRAKPPTKDFSKLRRTNFPIQEQWYGKLRVRVMKVRQEAKGEHSVAEYTVNTKLFGESFAKSYTDGDNRDCIATDTHKQCLSRSKAYLSTNTRTIWNRPSKALFKRIS